MVALLRLAEAARQEVCEQRPAQRKGSPAPQPGGDRASRGKMEDAGGPGREDRNEATETGTGFQSGTFQ